MAKVERYTSKVGVRLRARDARRLGKLVPLIEREEGTLGRELLVAATDDLEAMRASLGDDHFRVFVRHHGPVRAVDLWRSRSGLGPVPTLDSPVSLSQERASA